jgi:glycosyltransferase involved in cell wall biosynthesis
MKIAFIMTEWAMPRSVNPETMFDDPRGLTGSEISFIMYAKELAKLGHEVSLFSNFTHEIKLDCNFNLLNKINERCRENWDVALAWLDPTPLQLFGPNVKKIMNQQVNDFGYCPGWENYVDIITSPSQSHKDYIKRFTNFNLDKWKVLPNACDPSSFTPNLPRNNHLIFASSADRGLHWALEVFSKIKKELSEVEFHIYYNFKSFYERVKNDTGPFGDRLRYCHYAIEKLKGKGVFLHDSASRKQMAKIMSESKMMIYPCDPWTYTEGFSNSILESAVSGCLPVITSIDALGQIYGDHVPMVEAPYSNHKEEYLKLVIDLLKDENLYKEKQLRAKELGSIYNWQRLTKDVLLPIIN